MLYNIQYGTHSFDLKSRPKQGLHIMYRKLFRVLLQSGRQYDTEGGN